MLTRLIFPFLFLFILGITLPLFVFTSQHQQRLQQQAAGNAFPDPTNNNSPYGFTSVSGIDSDLVYRYKLLNIHWVRLQLPWNKIEIAPNQYVWSQLDQQIKTAIAAGIHVSYTIQDAPTFRKTTVCSTDNQPFLPSPQDTANFATLVAKRYNGDAASQGYIDSFEVFNEEPSTY